MEERMNDMELVERDDNLDIEEYDGYGIEDTEDSDEAGIDLAKVFTWLGIGALATGVVAFANRKKIKEAKRKADEKRMRKLAAKPGYDIVNPDDSIECDYEEVEIEDECETDEE